MSDPTSKSLERNTEDAQTHDPSNTTSTPPHATHGSGVDTKDAETTADSGSLDTSCPPDTASPPTQSDPQTPTGLTQDGGQNPASSNGSNTPLVSPVSPSDDLFLTSNRSPRSSSNAHPTLAYQVPPHAERSDAFKRARRRESFPFRRSSSNANN